MIIDGIYWTLWIIIPGIITVITAILGVRGLILKRKARHIEADVLKFCREARGNIADMIIKRRSSIIYLLPLALIINFTILAIILVFADFPKIIEWIIGAITGLTCGILTSALVKKINAKNTINIMVIISDSIKFEKKFAKAIWAYEKYSKDIRDLEMSSPPGCKTCEGMKAAFENDMLKYITLEIPAFIKRAVKRRKLKLPEWVKISNYKK